MNAWGDRRDERGATSIAQLVITAPVLLFALMAIVQFALMFHARNIAEQAAQEGAAAARHFDGTEAQGHDQAMQLLDSINGTLLERHVEVSRSATQVTVTVTGTVVAVVPGINLGVTETATGPVEKYVPPVTP